MTRATRHGVNPEMPGFAMRVDLAMTRLRDNAAAVRLEAKTTCTVGAQAVVETTTWGPPLGTVLVGERAIGSFLDPFYWQRLPVEPSRCDLRLFVDGVDAGRACITVGPELTFVGEACPVELTPPG